MLETPRTRTRIAAIVLVVCLVGAAVAAGAVATNAFGVGDRFDHLLARIDRFIAGPVPDRDTAVTIEASDPLDVPGPEDVDEAADDPPLTGDHEEAAAPPAAAAPAASEAPSLPAATAETVEPEPSDAEPPVASEAPPVVRAPVDVNIGTHPKRNFASQLTKDWCAPAGIQSALAIMGLVDTSDAVQRKINGKVRGYESYEDSHNGDWGPAAMVQALDEFGAPGYEIHAYKSRQGALRGAARAIDATGAPVILLAWRGAHTWVMTGYRANAAPSVFRDATISGAYIVDPWYPRISSIWGPSDPPGTFQDAAEMQRNFLQWRRPEGRYPDRDGRYIVVLPTRPAPNA